MSLANLIEQYGYIALFFGTLLEGETIMLIAGFAAHQSYLNLYWVMVIGFLGTFFTDQFFFFLGRYKGHDLLDKRPAWRERTSRFEKYFKTRQTILILGFRFIYGIRTVTPLFLGITRISVIRFLILNFTGAILWSITFALVGYHSGHTLELLIHDIKYLEKEIIGAVMITGLLIWLIRFYRKHLQKR